MTKSPLKEIQNFGQSIWLDYIRRDLIETGELGRLIEKDGLRGVTSNPAIFENAIAKSDIYDMDIVNLSLNKKNVQNIYESLSEKDVQSAADLFRKVYDRTKGKDGYVSIEVNPHLAYDTQGTIIEGRRLWRALERPNVLIKIPATLEGLPAIRQLVSEGININVTLLFGLSRYREVAEAYLVGLEQRLFLGLPLESISSVASFFIGRIDDIVDPLIEMFTNPAGTQSEIIRRVHGNVAISSAKAAYQIYKDIFHSARFKKLEEKGASVQRLLWASTGVKNNNYSDIKYIEAIIGPDTVNTLPLKTIDAYRDHGKPHAGLEELIEEAHAIMALLPELGIDIDKITHELETEGVKKFIESFDKLLNAIMEKSLAGPRQS